MFCRVFMLVFLNKSIILLYSFKGNVGFIKSVKLNFRQQKNLKTKKLDFLTNLNLKNNYSNINTLFSIIKFLYLLLKSQNYHNLISI